MKAGVEGAAQIDLQIAGSWAGNVVAPPSGFALPEVTGTVQLQQRSSCGARSKKARSKFHRRS